MNHTAQQVIPEKLRQLYAEVEGRFGVLPNFFRLVPENPEITANLWGFAQFAYLDNPLPSLFKERLFVHLSRFCEARYCVTRHVGFLAGLGRPSGDDHCPVQTIEEIVRLLRRPFPRTERLEPYFSQLIASESPLVEMPEPDSAMEEAIFACATHAYLQTPVALRCLEALKRVIGGSRFQHLTAFLAFVRTAHYWTMVHAELEIEEDVKQLLATHETLAECLLNDPEAGACEIDRRLTDELASLRVDQALRESEERFRKMIDALPAAIYATDAEGRLTHFNPAAAEFSGQEPELGNDKWRLSWKLYHPDGAPMALDECSMAVAIKEGRAIRGDETIAELPDGRRVWFQHYPTPLLDGKGRVVGGINMLVDITERKQAEASEARLAAIVESSDDAIISKDLNGVITSWNSGAEKLFGYTAEEVIGKPVAILIPSDRANEEPGILRRIRRGERIDHYETMRRCKDGREIDISLSVSPIFDKSGKVIGASKIARDISERKRVEMEREELLLKESAARAEAEAANRSKDEFLTMVSHELRSPLNAILGYNSMLRERLPDEAQSKQACDVIERNAKTQLRLIEDLLDTARIVSGKLRLEARPLDIGPVLADAFDMVRPAAEAKGVRLRIADLLIADSQLSSDQTKMTPPVGNENRDRMAAGENQSATRNPQPAIVMGDAARLQQIVCNLLSNAIKFTPAGGQVELRAERADEHIRIIVSDTGKGIQPDFLPHVFDRFRQIDPSSQRRQAGLGLGLALVKHLAELHSGKVEAASEGAGRGATFTVTLPLATESELVAAEPPALAAVGGTRVDDRVSLPAGLTIAGMRVLVVDDQEDARAVLAEFLDSCGAVVTTVASGAEALAVLSNTPNGLRPDVLVCDLSMPMEDGYTALRRMRALEAARGVAASQRIPAIALTALAGNEERLRALRAGFQCYIAKPADPVELMIVMANIMDMWRQE
jgi:PAS domain S-box-containing protein